MAGIATMLQDSGIDVQGSDTNAYPPMSTLLASRGITILKDYLPAHLASQPDFVVVGNVARRDNPEVVEAQRRGIPLYSMPQTIRRQFLKDRTSVTIAGTHGKTTVTSMMSWLLAHAGLDPSFLVGGIPLNFGSNYRLGEGNYFVIEGDEYDTAFFDKKAKFFHYNPTWTVLTSLEFDHADIYPDFSALKTTFQEYAATVNPEGCAVWCADYPILGDIVEECRCRTISYGQAPHAHWRIDSFESNDEGTRFTLQELDGRIHQLFVPMWGRHNVLNATAAYVLGIQMGLEPGLLSEGLALFKGVMRRFQTIARKGRVTIIDDFAHHPTAVQETIQAARSRFPEATLHAVYHFSSNTSRRRLFEREYSQAFGGADHVYLTYPLRKADNLSDDDYLNPETVLDGIRTYATSAQAFAEFPEMAVAMADKIRPSDVVIAMSGRDLTPLYEALVPHLERPEKHVHEEVVG
jgi:UDP-N-acetylmuramate: L-alanyl-gamma-D-glutamyl-meso-diaminopimelate ligase